MQTNIGIAERIRKAVNKKGVAVDTKFKDKTYS
jgi:hypothetical protein